MSSSDCLAAVVDSAGADLLAVKFSGDYLEVNAINDGTYALVTTSGLASDGDNTGGDTGDGSVNPPTGVNGAVGFAAVALLAMAALSMTVLMVTKKEKKSNR